MSTEDSMKERPETGYAVKNFAGQIVVRSICETPRGAKVNWLLTDARLLALADASDDAIEAAWQESSAVHGAVLIRVAISEIEEPRP